MGKTVSAREANQHFSRLLAEAEAGTEVTITRRGKPVARLGPVGVSHDVADRLKALDELFARAGREPPLKGGKWRRDDLYDR